MPKGSQPEGSETLSNLATFALDAHIDFEVSAYGSDDSVRAKLVEVARQRAAAKYRREFGRRSTVLIGDAPNDIAAGRDAGASIVAVASGRSMDELRAAEAEVVLQTSPTPSSRSSSGPPHRFNLATRSTPFRSWTPPVVVRVESRWD
jgi:HAD-hyrolase-like